MPSQAPPFELDALLAGIDSLSAARPIAARLVTAAGEPDTDRCVRLKLLPGFARTNGLSSLPDTANKPPILPAWQHRRFLYEELFNAINNLINLHLMEKIPKLQGFSRLNS